MEVCLLCLLSRDTAIQLLGMQLANSPKLRTFQDTRLSVWDHSLPGQPQLMTGYSTSTKARPLLSNAGLLKWRILAPESSLGLRLSSFILFSSLFPVTGILPHILLKFLTLVLASASGRSPTGTAGTRKGLKKQKVRWGLETRSLAVLLAMRISSIG